MCRSVKVSEEEQKKKTLLWFKVVLIIVVRTVCVTCGRLLSDHSVNEK